MLITRFTPAGMMSLRLLVPGNSGQKSNRAIVYLRWRAEIPELVDADSDRCGDPILKRPPLGNGCSRAFAQAAPELALVIASDHRHYLLR